ncbi:RNA recognition motif [Carpediemonas membranifera]|uniref:RNA recognition motif n=1 Tax=Carpediemonas membranifera TaxID=201153 RepID=A0A8J6B2I0_9EUKA|nr:RNA recognition motif [Carpediemonas membranifera]|eukprot:KAG9391514.1 RNA recognition motif [Carpediemonas membranifera]
MSQDAEETIEELEKELLESPGYEDHNDQFGADETGDAKPKDSGDDARDGNDDVDDLENELDELEKDVDETHRKIEETRQQLAGSHGMSVESLGVTREEDERSVFITGFDPAATDKDIEGYFAKCGEIVRVTIKRTPAGGSKGQAFIEFKDFDSVKMAVMLHDSIFRGREIRVLPKRTNIPGMGVKRLNTRGRGGYRGRGGRGGFRARGGYRGRGRGRY